MRTCATTGSPCGCVGPKCTYTGFSQSESKSLGEQGPRLSARASLVPDSQFFFLHGGSESFDLKSEEARTDLAEQYASYYEFLRANIGWAYCELFGPHCAALHPDELDKAIRDEMERLAAIERDQPSPKP